MTDAERDQLTLLLGAIDERTKATKDIIDKIEQVQSEIFSKINENKSQLDMLQQAHNDRTGQQIDCTGKPTVPKNMIALIGGISSGTSIILLIVLLLILHAMGFNF